MLRVLIAIPIYYREEAGINCILSLLKTTIIPPNVTVTVVMGINLASDEFKERVNGLDKTYAGGSMQFSVIDYGKNIGKPAVVNDIASKFPFDYLMSLDGDMICVDQKWLAGMLGMYTAYNADPIRSHINGKHFGVPMGSLCINQLGNNVHFLFENSPGAITKKIGPLTLITRMGSGRIAGGGLMTDYRTWTTIGGYSTKVVYGGDDGYYHGECTKRRLLSAYVKEIGFYHPYEMNKEYQAWKIRAINSFCDIADGLKEGETEGFKFENT